MDTKGQFYLGRTIDPQTGKTGAQPMLYDPDDLTTHAVVVGMTGSGKTGLCIGILEEIALHRLPALMIDPKGDITNTLLHFPNLLPEDFKPWVNPDQARRAGQSLEEAAGQAAELWKKGLADWEIAPERIQALKDAAHFAIYTPGSDAGIPVSILDSFKAPAVPWEDNREMLREKISATVVALLGLVGLTDIDPVRSREHILLSNIFEYAWSKGKDLDLGELIMQTQTPPFPKLGVFDIDTFFPEKSRFELAMLLNNILAAPSFHAWIEGHPLDIQSLLYAEDGRPRHSVFYIAHLPEAERMFFVTLLFSAFEAWMRTQTGTTTLRSIIYFDEIFGYLPPVSNPPSKQPMLRLLKQARAFGAGLLLATQNPVDVDYKALSNAGTWFIGRLQTQQDKERLLDGLEGVLGSGTDRATMDRMLSGLGKRVFLMNNVNEPKPVQFQTRWAMNYLAGPLTRTQVPALNNLAGASWGRGTAAVEREPAQPSTKGAPMQPSPAAPVPSAYGAARPPEPAAEQRLGSTTRPAVPGGIDEYVLPNNLTLTEAARAGGKAIDPGARRLGLLYRPVLLAQARARFLNRKYDLDYDQVLTALVSEPDRRGAVRWEDFSFSNIDESNLAAPADTQARYLSLEKPLSDPKMIASMQKDFLDWVLNASRVSVRANETLKVYAGPQVTQAEFRSLCSEAARDLRDKDQEKTAAAYDKKIETLQNKLEREQLALQEDETELSHRKMEEIGTHAETILSLFGKRRRSLSSSMSKRRLTAKAGEEVKESQKLIASLQKQIADIEKEKTAALDRVNENWSEVANQIDEIPVTPLKKDVILDFFGVAWFPYHLVQVGQEVVELPGFAVQ